MQGNLTPCLSFLWPEIPDRTFRRALETLVQSGQVQGTGETRWRKYRLASLGHGEDDGR